MLGGKRELCQERHEVHGYKEGTGTGPLCLEEYYVLGIRPVLVRVLDIVVSCVFGVTDVNAYMMMMMNVRVYVIYKMRIMNN